MCLVKTVSCTNLLLPQALTLAAVRKDDKADLSLRSVYNYGNYGLTAVFNTSDKVHVTATVDKVGGGQCVGLQRWGKDTHPGTSRGAAGAE